MQVVFVFIVNAFNEETVSRKQVSCAPLKMCLSYFAFIIHMHLSFIPDWLYQPCCCWL